MHHIYHTEGIVLGSRNFGETGKYYRLCTRDLGLVLATASGVRKMSSKLRYVLQDFSYVKIDLVKGKDFWRIGSASKTNELCGLLAPEILPTMGNIAKLLIRLLPGEDPNPALFGDILSGLRVLEKSAMPQETGSVEAVIVLRILHKLGYIGGGNEAIGNLTESPFEENLIFEASKNRARILREINSALKETHL